MVSTVIKLRVKKYIIFLSVDFANNIIGYDILSR